MTAKQQQEQFFEILKNTYDISTTKDDITLDEVISTLKSNLSSILETN
ncbi:hypothetical protein [Peribacillus acanthi]|nr:hypothetical protein [Peribacillus acanthi]